MIKLYVSLSRKSDKGTVYEDGDEGERDFTEEFDGDGSAKIKSIIVHGLTL